MSDENLDFYDCPEMTPLLFDKAVVGKYLKPVSRQAQLTVFLDEKGSKTLHPTRQNIQDIAKIGTKLKESEAFRSL